MPTSVPSRTGNTVTITNNKPSARDREMMTPPTVADALLRLPPLSPPLYCRRYQRDPSHTSKSTPWPL